MSSFYASVSNVFCPVTSSVKVSVYYIGSFISCALVVPAFMALQISLSLILRYRTKSSFSPKFRWSNPFLGDGSPRSIFTRNTVCRFKILRKSFFGPFHLHDRQTFAANFIFLAIMTFIGIRLHNDTFCVSSTYIFRPYQTQLNGRVQRCSTPIRFHKHKNPIQISFRTTLSTSHTKTFMGFGSVMRPQCVLYPVFIASCKRPQRAVDASLYDHKTVSRGLKIFFRFASGYRQMRMM